VTLHEVPHNSRALDVPVWSKGVVVAITRMTVYDLPPIRATSVDDAGEVFHPIHVGWPLLSRLTVKGFSPGGDDTRLVIVEVAVKRDDCIIGAAALRCWQAVGNGAVAQTMEVDHTQWTTWNLSIANKGRSSDWTNSCKPIHMGRSMVGEHAPIRDPCLVDAVQIDAVLADYLLYEGVSEDSVIVTRGKVAGTH